MINKDLVPHGPEKKLTIMMDTGAVGQEISRIIRRHYEPGARREDQTEQTKGICHSNHSINHFINLLLQSKMSIKQRHF